MYQNILSNFHLRCIGHGWNIPVSIKFLVSAPDNLNVYISWLCSLGLCSFFFLLQTCSWSIGQIPKDKSPSLSGNLVLETGLDRLHVFPVFQVGFKIMGVALSGLQIHKLDIKNAPSQPYKGFRALTQAGEYEVRSWEQFSNEFILFVTVWWEQVSVASANGSPWLVYDLLSKLVIPRIPLHQFSTILLVSFSFAATAWCFLSKFDQVIFMQILQLWTYKWSSYYKDIVVYWGQSESNLNMKLQCKFECLGEFSQLCTSYSISCFLLKMSQCSCDALERKKIFNRLTKNSITRMHSKSWRIL